MRLREEITPVQLEGALRRFWKLSGQKIRAIESEYDASQGSPVFTVQGKYTTRGWTEWTQGFQYGSAILQFDATGDDWFLQCGRRHTIAEMAPHVSHTGVHDHGFNNVSTYGNLLRLMREGRIPENHAEADFYELALKVSAAVQAARWTTLPDGGYIYSFNGPHSLFVDTMRSVRVLSVGEALGHCLMGENDRRFSLLERAMQHTRATARYSIYYEEGRDRYDVRGRVAHEAVFNVNDGAYRCPNAQQGYSGFSTWTRGLAWAMTGFAEQLEFLPTRSDEELDPLGGREMLESMMLKAARATCDFYVEHTPADGIPYWDTGAPNLHRIEGVYENDSDPFNPWEPIDSSAAAIACQGLVRLGRLLGHESEGKPYWQAGLTVLARLMETPYLSEAVDHHGLILHSIYHHPNGWDHIPKEQTIPCGESSMWGDYHAREAALLVQRLARDEPYLTFYSGTERQGA